MKRSRASIAFAGLLAVGLSLAVPAFATNQPVVFYDPPRILFKDLPGDPSVENLDVTKVGSNFSFVTTGGPSATADSPKCDFVVGGVECPVAGIRRIAVNLGDLADQAQINLGSRARRVSQTLRGQDGDDILLGEKGPQVIKGGEGTDTLQGGAGPDVLNGGPGPDTCSGGPGDDTIIKCEA